MPAHRADRISESIRREMPSILRMLKDPRISELITVVRVEVSGDLSLAKIYISDINGMAAAENSVKGLKSAAPLVKREIGGRLALKKAPEVKFIADNSIEHSAHISEMLKELNKN